MDFQLGCCNNKKDRTASIQCDNCDKWYHRRCLDMSWSQYRTLERPNEPWLCASCEFNAATTTATVTTVETTTPPELNEPLSQNSQSFKCSQCPRSFSSKVGLDHHQRHHHGALYRGTLVDKKSGVEDEEDDDKEPNQSPIHQINKNLKNISRSLQRIYDAETFDQALFLETYNSLCEVLREANSVLPGPKHPATKFYEMRKKRTLFKANDKNYSHSTNPQRSSKRARQRRIEKYNYDLTQYEYYNKRKACVRKLMNPDKQKSCSIPMKTLESTYNDRWSQENNQQRQSYEQISFLDQNAINNTFTPLVDKDTVDQYIRKMNSQSSAGFDKITVRVLKSFNCAEPFSWLFSIFMKWNYVPDNLKEARTTLVYKKGDTNDPGNWRPISCCSVIRRLYEKIILMIMREYTTVSKFQTGSRNVPGTFINSTILNGCLQLAKKLKKDITIIFLDIAKAFDSIGHKHIQRTIDARPYPDQLRQIIYSLAFGNSTRIVSKHETSQPIALKRGIFQGSVISPEIFNLAINFVLQSLTDTDIAQSLGFCANTSVNNVSSLGFVDDTAVVGKNSSSACQLMDMAIDLFNEIGLDVNIEKTQAIVLQEGRLSTDAIIYNSSNIIKPIGGEETVKYLGVNFNDEIVFDSAGILKNIQKSIETLVSTPFLHPNQKIAIINQFVWPTAIYPLQSAPLIKIPTKFLDSLDKIIRSATREILLLPQDAPNAMLYSPYNLKGLNVVNASWEACIQSHGICLTLQNCKNEYVNILRDFESEKELAINRLKIPVNDYKTIMEETHLVSGVNRKLRSFKQNEEFAAWSKMIVHGKGIETFAQCKPINSSLFAKKGLSTNEYICYFRMVSNTAAVKALHGRSQGSHHCRRCNETSETLSHILGLCPFGMLLRNDRHHRIRSCIAEDLKQNGFEVHEELPTLDRRIDIIAINHKKNYAVILDPTIRTETSIEQATDVDIEKKAIYEPCIEDLRIKCNLNPQCQITVHGLLIGSRGTIPTSVQSLLKELGVSKSVIEDIATIAVKGSCRILHNHLYSPQIT